MIRKAKQWDIDGLLYLLGQIADLHRAKRPDIFKSEGQKYNKEALEEILKNESRPIFVAVDNKEHILGYCFCQLRKPNHPIFEEHLTLYIDDFCVDQTLRGKGIGKNIFDTVLAYARAQKVYNIELNVWAFNKDAIKFYENLGFSAQRIHMEMQL